jgi:hypothetical protein
MATGGEVLTMLCPLGGWVIYGDDFDSIIWTDERPKCTQAQFAAGFAQYDAWKSEQNAKAATDKAAILEKLGITADEAKLLLG